MSAETSATIGKPGAGWHRHQDSKGGAQIKFEAMPGRVSGVGGCLKITQSGPYLKLRAKSADYVCGLRYRFLGKFGVSDNNCPVGSGESGASVITIPQKFALIWGHQ